MPPKRGADANDESSLNMPVEERMALLNAVAHIIAIGTIIGGSGALMCYISPAIEAFLVSKGLVPMLCSGTGFTGSVEWIFRLIAAPVASIETCMAIQARYELMIKQIIASIGIPSGLGIFYERARFAGCYLAYKNAMYKVLKYCVDEIASKFSRSAVQTPSMSETDIKLLVDQAVLNTFPELRGADPSMAGPSMYSPSMASPSMAGPSMYSPSMAGPSMYSPSMTDDDGTPEPEEYNDEEGYTSTRGYFGGVRRHRKRKTAKKTRKARKHRSRRHR